MLCTSRIEFLSPAHFVVVPPLDFNWKFHKWISYQWEILLPICSKFLFSLREWKLFLKLLLTDPSRDSQLISKINCWKGGRLVSILRISNFPANLGEPLTEWPKTQSLPRAAPFELFRGTRFIPEMKPKRGEGEGELFKLGLCSDLNFVLALLLCFSSTSDSSHHHHP